ncbi:hypothetical protein [Flavobacterium gilvum]|uniref:Uncharacterized protein n=1 Tax=Flavobacterium gilvum TaxID=1492737 RepID=A0AAC9I6I5_9FLAO|nr:hypothetical protein [Flavobacterium gilvum]AOW08759.1 hypothetical protein EM308_04160 [Flavobacterium gilvum]AOW09533.1 hypothetical protein EM308_08475 [Flavobacterium gilvum]KFC60041.1 hypothetical protein FEM08_12200 [Flavobacterium gilvum]
MLGFLLFIIAYLLFWPLSLLNFFFVEDKKGYFRSSAKSIDIFACREFRTFWNKKLITKNGYKFGKEGETISSALGKNILLGSLTKTGKVLVWILSEKHCLDAIFEIH